MNKLYARMFVKKLVRTKQNNLILSSSDIKKLSDKIIRKIPNVSKKELESIISSPAKINNFLEEV